MVFTRRQAAAYVAQAGSPDRRAPARSWKREAPKRKLFEAEPAPSSHAAPEAGGAAAAELELGSPSASMVTEAASSPAPAGRSLSQPPSAPPTPKTVDRERPPSDSPALPPLHPSLEPAMAYAVQRWRENLVALQPKVRIGDASLLGALALVRALSTARPDLGGTLHDSPPHLLAYTAAALWLAAKTCDVRTAIPNRTLMSQACQIHPQALSDFELDLCLSLNWEVTKVLRTHELLL